LVSDIQAGERKNITFFYSVIFLKILIRMGCKKHKKLALCSWDAEHLKWQDYYLVFLNGKKTFVLSLLLLYLKYLLSLLAETGLVKRRCQEG
jgi:hypothetical protein